MSGRTFEHSLKTKLWISWKLKYNLPIGPNNCTPQYLPKTNENSHPHRLVWDDSQQRYSWYPPSGRSPDGCRECAPHITEYYSTIKRNEMLTPARKGSRTCHPRICHFGIVIIWSYRLLKNSRCKESLSLNSPICLKTDAPKWTWLSWIPSLGMSSAIITGEETRSRLHILTNFVTNCHTSHLSF